MMAVIKKLIKSTNTQPIETKHKQTSMAGSKQHIVIGQLNVESFWQQQLRNIAAFELMQCHILLSVAILSMILFCYQQHTITNHTDTDI